MQRDDYYNAEIAVPKMHDTYLVKTKEGTYEFAHFNCNGWEIQGDNKGATVKLWMQIPTTDR